MSILQSIHFCLIDASEGLKSENNRRHFRPNVHQNPLMGICVFQQITEVIGSNGNQFSLVFRAHLAMSQMIHPLHLIDVIHLSLNMQTQIHPSRTHMSLNPLNAFHL